MRITAVEEYGLRCLLTLAKEGTAGQLSISEIAEKEWLSIPYASKRLGILLKSGLMMAAPAQVPDSTMSVCILNNCSA